MKRMAAFLLSFAFLLSGCASSPTQESSSDETDISTVQESGTKISDINQRVEFTGLDDTDFLMYIEDTVYENLVAELDSSDYFVENVQTVYLSQEYIEELEYNSKSNIYFGYTLADLEEEFSGDRYVFTLDDDGKTTVVSMEVIDDNTYNQLIKNVAIGTGVILVCVTVSVATAGVAPAVSLIFAASATSATTFAASCGGIGFVAAGLARGYQTHDFDEALKAATLAGSEGFKWGAISGAVVGGGQEAFALKGATLNGLTMNEAAKIQQQTNWPLSAIKSIHSTAEAEIYTNANLIPTQLSDGSWAFLREINWNLVDDYGRTNVERVLANLAPIDEMGMPFELHHIGQMADSPLAILSNAEHHSSGNFSILHYKDVGKNVTDAEWSAQKKAFWQAILKMSGRG